MVSSNGALVTRQQIAALLGVTVYAVDKWRKRGGGFPQVVTVFGQSPVWREAEVIAWAEATGRA